MQLSLPSRRRTARMWQLALVTVCALALGAFSVTRPQLPLALLVLTSVAVTTWRWPQVVPAILLAGPGFLHALTSLSAGAATRSEVLASPVAFIPLLVALFGSPLLRTLGRPDAGVIPSIASGSAGRWFFRGALLLLLLLVIRLPGSPSPVYGVTKTIGFVAYSVFPALMILFVFRSTRDARRILIAIAFIGVAWLTLSLAIAVSQGSLNLYRTDPGALLGGANQSGAGLAGPAVLVALIGIGGATNARGLRLLFLAAALLGVVTLVLSGHRGSLAAFLAGVVTLGVLNIRRLKLSQGLAGAATLALVIWVSLAVIGAAPSEIQERFQDPFASASFDDRIGLQRVAIDGWVESPLFGQGTGSSGFFVAGGDQGDFGVVSGIYPHNVTVELLLELGIVGALVYIVTIGGTVVRGYRSRRVVGRDEEWVLLVAIAVVVAAFVASQGGADLTIQNDLWILGAVLAVAAVGQGSVRQPVSLLVGTDP